MKLQTNIPLQEEKRQITYDSKVLLLGSCFSENIGEKLDYFKFQAVQNPFGILFNPVSMELLLRRTVEQRYFGASDIFEKDGQWHCFEVHSLISATGKEAYLALLNGKLDALKEYLSSTSHVILTYGTSWVYSHRDTNSIVANCHKIPQKEFEKELLSVERISEAIKNSVAHIKALCPEAIVITTLSPVRHLKDGFVENSRSKAQLLIGMQLVVEQQQDVFYFPSYELMMDELRDYRFYTSDLLHPNDTAIAIIWEKFRWVWISSETESLQKEVDIVQRGLQHRPFNAEGLEHQKFQKNLREKIEKLKKSLPHIDLSAGSV